MKTRGPGGPKEAITPQAGFYCESNYIGGAEREQPGGCCGDSARERAHHGSLLCWFSGWIQRQPASPALNVYNAGKYWQCQKAELCNIAATAALGGIIQRITFKFEASFEFNHSIGNNQHQKLHASVPMQTVSKHFISSTSTFKNDSKVASKVFWKLWKRSEFKFQTTIS